MRTVPADRVSQHWPYRYTPQLFGTVIIPTAVGVELREAKRPQTIRSFIGNPPTWLIERTPKTIENFPLLDAGEVAAINLALEIKADLLLIDESLMPEI